MWCTSEAPQRKRCTSFIDLVARLRFLFVGPCAARSSAQVTRTRGRGHPTVLGARWRSPLALTSDHPPPIHPFVFEAVAPRKLVSQLREITFSGPLASFVGKNFDTRQDACWGSFAMKPFVPHLSTAGAGAINVSAFSHLMLTGWAGGHGRYFKDSHPVRWKVF